jgi:DNA-binding beta-propeller fold protein YncE
MGTFRSNSQEMNKPANFGAQFPRLFQRMLWVVALTALALMGSSTAGAEVFLFKWGTCCTGDGQMQYPSGIAVNSSGTVYVADVNNRRIQFFSSSGAFLGKWGTSGSGDGQFNHFYSVALDSSGQVYVADRNNHRIQVFSSTGDFIRKWGTFGTGNGQFQYPYGVAVDGTGQVYVTDTNNNRVQVFSSSGVFLTKWTANYPYGIAVDDSSGRVYVTDVNNSRIQAFTKLGSLLGNWGSYGTGDGQFNQPYGVAVDNAGQVFVADTYNNRIQVLSSAGGFLRKWGTGGAGNGQLYWPFAVTMDASGRAYVADSYNHRIQVFGLPGNAAPVLSPIGNRSVQEGGSVEFILSATDPDGNGLAYSAGNLPPGATFNPLTATFSWTTGYNQAGAYQDILFTVIDDGSPPLSDSEAITITVGNVNRPPVLDPIGNKAVSEGAQLQFVIVANDPDGDSLTYSASNLPTGAVFDPATQTFIWTPAFNQEGSYPNILFTVNDAGNPALSDSESITVTVGNVNRPPILDPVGHRAINEGEALSITLTATDSDSDGLTYTASNLPEGASFDPSTQTFIWTPSYGQAGNYEGVLFSVTDGTASDSEAITITVGDINRPPILNPIGSKTVNEGQTLTFAVSATDPDGDDLIYRVGEMPAGAGFDAVTRSFSWTPIYEQAGTYTVVFTVTDVGTPSLNTSEAVSITVGNVNRPPVLDPIGNKWVNEGETLTFTLTATDPDGNDLIFSANNLPAGANFNPIVRSFTWTPTLEQGGNYENVEFSVMDNGNPAHVDVELITITVGNINRAPVFDAIGPQTGDENVLLEFCVGATDPDGDAITYSTEGLPAGATFNSATLCFSWRPGEGQEGIHVATFYARDNGTPPLTGTLEVVMTINNVSTPIELAEEIIRTVERLNLPKHVENSYMANLRKVPTFISEGKIAPAVNQLEAFISKVQSDMAKGIINQVDGNKLIQMARNLINILLR